MHIAEGVDELTGLKTTYLRHHQGEKGVRGNVERHAEKHIGTALVELAG